MAKLLTSKDEDTLLEVIKRASELVEEDGLSPNDALTKLAREYKLKQGQITLACNTFNTGKQTHQRQDSETALDKFAFFEVADPDVIIRDVFKPQEKQASFSDYESAPDWYVPKTFLENPKPIEKAASVDEELHFDLFPKPDAPKRLTPSQKAPTRERLKHAAQTSASDALRLEFELEGKLASLNTFFGQSEFNRKPFAFYEKAAQVYFGGPYVEALCETLHTNCPQEKRANAKTVINIPYDGAYKHMVTKMAECADLLKKFEAAQAKAQMDKQAQDDFENPPTPQVAKYAFEEIYMEEYGFEKKSLAAPPMVAPTFGSLLGNVIGRTFSAPNEKSELVNKMVNKLDSPDHAGELRKIRVQTMLNNMITDPDEPIAGHDMNAIMSAYNELSRLAPQAADQPAIVRSYLRRRLTSGGMEPFETKELVDIESKLRKNMAPGSPSGGGENG